MQITMARIFLTIPVIMCLYPNTFYSNIFATLFFIIASISDYYDGYFARKWNATTNMGKFMDPIADKILVTSILTFLIAQGKCDPVMVTLLMVRDTLVGGIRAVAAADGLVIAAKSAGKWKTALQMAAIPAVILWELPFWPELGSKLGWAGYFLLWISVILSISSGIDYWNVYKKARKGRV